MKIRLCVVGKFRKGPELEIFNRYLLRVKKIGRAINFFPVEVNTYNDFNIKSSFFDTHKDNLFAKEKYKFMLDESGKNITSVDFAKKLSQVRDQGYSESLFFIGGAHGFPNDFEDKFDFKLGFGTMVWPHTMVRLMLIEQIYRASTIIAGTPYHKD